MSETGTDQRTAPGESTPGKSPPPAEFATQVATLIGDDAPFRSDELPLWSRLGKPKRQPGKLLPGLAWSVAIALAVVAKLRVLCHDTWVPLTWLNAFTLYLYLPAYLTLAYSAWTKRWWLATVSAAVIACHLTWVAPDFRRVTPYVPAQSAATGTSLPLKIFFANVRGGSNMDLDAVLAEAQRGDPDVIVLVEMQRYWWHEMIRRRPLPGYPFGTNLPNRNAGDVAVFSRVPVRRMEEVRVEDRTSLIVDLILGTQQVHLVALHSPRPTLKPTDDYYSFWEALEPIIAELPGPTIVVGDFNATQHSRVYEQLQDDGLRSAHEDRGRGYATTWPNGVHWIPPIRIDQAFLSPEVECVSIQEGAGPGSDHKPLVIELRVHGAGSSATVKSSHLRRTP